MIARHNRWRALFVQLFTLTLTALLFLPVAAHAVPIEAAARGGPRIGDVRGVRPGQTLTGRIVIEAKVSGARPRAVVFQLDGPQRHSHTEYGAPYFFMGGVNGKPKGWDTARFPDGIYTLRITATDREGRKDSETVQFRLANHIAPQPQPSVPVEPTTEPKPDDPFAPPQLHNPKTVYLSNARPSYRGNGSEDVRVVVTEKLTRPAAVRNVRNLIMVGGEFTIDQPIPQHDWPGVRPANNPLVMRHKALSFADISGTGYVEGIHVNGTNGRMSEGIQIWGNSKGRIIIRNSRIEGVRTARADRDRRNPVAHCDLIQLMAGSLFLENVTLAGSEFQGLFMKAEHGNRLGDVRLRNVNVRDVLRQPLWPFRFAGGGKLQEAHNVWVEPARRTGVEGGYLPREGRIISADTVTWRGNPNVADGVVIRQGNPPNGDFAPAQLVGRRYAAAAFR